MPRKENKQISFYVTEELHKQIKEQAILSGKTMKRYITDLHKENLAREKQEDLWETHLQSINLLMEEVRDLKNLVANQTKLIQKLLGQKIQEPVEVDNEPVVSLHDVMASVKHPEDEQGTLHDLAKGGLGKFISKEATSEPVKEDEKIDEFTQLIEEALNELGQTEVSNLDLRIKDSSGKTISAISNNPPKPNTKPMEDVYTEEFTHLLEEALKNI
ncbi:MAG: hypothetical protein D6732_13865 [Methanobacteriota archaeon]|nr:MAG: hypothetical protein D6732_13865 [Euryarchaeota archaeon]